MNSAQVANNKFCGPAVVSIIAGVNTDTAEQLFQKQRKNNKPVRGAFTWEVISALDMLGYKSTKLVTHTPSLFGFLTGRLTPGIYMIMVTGHFVVVEVTTDGKRLFCDNHTKTPINGAASARLGMKVIGAWLVVSKGN